MPSNLGLAALAGILGGVGKGVQTGFDEGTQDALNQQKMGLQTRQLDLLDTYRKDQLAQRREQAMLPFILEQAKSAADREREATRQKGLGESLLGLDDPEMQTLGNMLRGGGISHAAGEKAYLERMKGPSQGGTGHIVHSSEGIYVVPTNKQGAMSGPPQDTGLKPGGTKSSEYQSITESMIGEGRWGRPGDPSFDIERGRRMERIIPAPAGSELWRKRNIPGGGPITTPGEHIETAPGHPQPPMAGGPSVSRPAFPTGGEREDIALLDSAQQQLTSIVQTVKSGALNNIMGGVAKNPRGTLNRLTEEYLGYGLNDEQRKAMGVLAMQLQDVKHALIGATRTRPELADIAAAIPDEKSLLRGDTAEQVLPKLEALLENLKVKRAMREGAMRSTGVAVPANPAPRVPAPVAPKAPVAPPAQQAPPGNFSQYKEGQRLYSPSQKRYFRIQGGVPVPE